MLSPLHTDPALRPDRLNAMSDAERTANALLAERRARRFARLAQAVTARIARWISSPA